MKRPFVLSLILLTFFQIGRTQYYEAGITFGGANYIGDLSEQRFDGENIGGMIGIFARFNATKYLSIKSNLMKGTVSASDASARAESNRMRNLHFRSDILELSLTSEINFQPFNIRAKQTSVPYFFSGIAFTHFNPQAQMRGSWYDLQPLQTEGKDYKKNILAIPFGLGMKFNISYKLNFGVELGARKIFTDYLDDVSTLYPDLMTLRGEEPTAAALAYRTPELTGEFGEDPSGLQRGDSGNDDWYFFLGATVSVNLTDKYGLDFDKKYEVFKEHLKNGVVKKDKPEKIKKEKSERAKKRKISKRKKTSKYHQKKRKLLQKKKKLQAPVKKRTN